MANKNHSWHRGNGSPAPEWFKEHIEWIRNVVEELRETNRIMEEENKKRDKDIAVAKIEAKSAIAIAQKLGVDVTEIKKIKDVVNL